MIKIKLELNDKVYKGEGKTSLEAVKSIKEPEFFKTRAFMTATDGKKTFKLLLPIFKVKRLFMTEMHQIVMSKNIDIMLQ